MEDSTLAMAMEAMVEDMGMLSMLHVVLVLAVCSSCTTGICQLHCMRRLGLFTNRS